MWGLSIFTMAMTVPQILTIWVDRQAAGVSTLSWSAYLAVAVVWLWYGLRKRDANIYLPSVGWIILDSDVESRHGHFQTCCFTEHYLPN
jgi:uncharacterized protein with PQ loop repeat